MRRGLTIRAIETMRPGSCRREIPDHALPGLYFLVQPSGAKSWAVRYRHAGQTRKFTLGSYPVIDLKTARELGAKALRVVAEGRDPGRERDQSRSTMPRGMDAITAEFLEKHCKRHNRAKTARDTEGLLRLHVLPRWRGRTIESITRRDVLDVLDRVVNNGTPVAANRVLSAVRKLFNWAVSRDIILTSPCTGVKPPSPETPRDRILTDDELRLVWQASQHIGWPFEPLVQMLALTGQRREEVARMQWDEIDFAAKVWKLPRERTKNNQPHEVPLSTLTVSIIQTMPRIADSPYVFTTNGRAAFSGFSKVVRRLRSLLPPDMPQWTLHDLRRTCASGMARLGINLPVIEKVLNHSSGSFARIVGVYQRHNFAEEKRAALEVWAQHVAGLTQKKR
jgi:integrase